MVYDVAVVGGGLSGLAASVDLALNGARVVLLEQAAKLGGRAYSYVDRKTGDIVDNGQHVLVGAYRHTLRYLKTIGTRELLTLPEDFHLHLHHPRKGLQTFSFNSIPFGLALATLRFPLLSLPERSRLLNAGLKLRKWDKEFEATLRRLTIADWLMLLKQSPEARRTFWDPLAVSVMNESPEKASAYLFAQSLRATFLSDAFDAKILIPTVGQSELYVSGAMKLFAERATKVLTNTEVRSLAFTRQKVTGVILKNGKHLSAKAVVAAVPYFVLPRLLPDKQLQRMGSGPRKTLGHFESSPIVSINLWFDGPIMDRDFVGLVGRRVQWIFNRRRIMREHDKHENYLSAIISGAHQYVNLSREKLVTMAVEDIASAYPRARQAKLVHSIVIKERRATFSPTNDVEPLRPSQSTPITNLFLAGDWTDTGLPPTIEGAIMSGFRCAELAKHS